MSEENQEQQRDAAVVRDDAVDQQAAGAQERHGPPPRTGWRGRVYGVRSVAAVAVAGLIVGGGAGAAIHAAVGDDGGRDGRPGFMRDGGPGDGPRGRFGGPGSQVPGQVPGSGPGQGQLPEPPNGMPAPPDGVPQQPATPPEDDVAPDGSGDTGEPGDTT